MRAFLALPIPEPALGALVQLQGFLPFGRSVPEENLHLTLAFLGEVTPDVVEEIDLSLSGLRLPQVSLEFGGLGTFAEMTQGLVYVDVRGTAALDAVQAKVAQIARGAGAELPRRRFRPHVTIQRANRQPRGAARDKLALTLGMPAQVPSVVADRITLYESQLTPAGARHLALADYPLG